MKALITGGAGFIGSHLLDRLISLHEEVIVLDNLSSGTKANMSHSTCETLHFIQGDCTDKSDVKEAMKDVDILFHLAANAEVRLELNDPQTCFQQNIYATHLVLEELRQSTAHTIVFASTSTVYGDATRIPTPEDYPTRPISIYGASKLASEALITSYAHTYDVKTVILRLANIVGPRSNHGVIHDFISKLKSNPKKLEILGDGSQTKSYLHIDDCIDAILQVTTKSKELTTIYNVGSQDQINVKDIAKLIVEEMDLNDVVFQFMGGINGGRGWKGDVKKMLLDVAKLESLGWKNIYNSADAIRQTIRSLLNKSSNDLY
jgi:UDP-glucose 4-epimerase